jgi:FkbM family methyltransferase
MPRKRYNVVMATEQGSYIMNKNDIGVGAQLSASGAYDPDEIALFRGLVGSLGRQDAVVLDIGANIGIHAVSLADMVGPQGRVHAFEAQRIVFYMLAGNVALNSIENVYCRHVAVGAAPGRIEIPQFDYGRPLSFGSVEFGPEQHERIGQARGNDPQRVEHVEVITVDGLDFPAVHIMKIDVEGMELDVLNGAARTIRRDRPIIYVEYLKGDRKALASWLLAAGYRLHIHRHNWLCLPPGTQVAVQGSSEITSASEV